MNPKSSVRATLLALLIVSTLESSSVYAVGPVYLEIVADQDYSSVDPLAPFDIRFILHANGNLIQGMEFPMQLKFSNGNILGTMAEYPNGEAQVIWSPVTMSTFASRSINEWFGGQPTSPDTMVIGLVSFGPAWRGSGEVFRIRFTPKDTGTVKFDPTLGPGFLEFGRPAYFDPLGGVQFGETWTSTIHVPPQPGAVRFRVSTSSGTDTLFFGVPGTIYFDVDAMGNEIIDLIFGFKWTFSNGNVVGPFSDLTGEVQYSPVALGIFEDITFGPYQPQGTDSDTSVVGFLDFDDGGISGSNWIWSVTFDPLDTGTIFIDSNFMHPPSWVNIYAMGRSGSDLPSNFIPGRIAVVPCPYHQMGDVNQDDVLTSADLIYFINYMFKSGPDPLPERSIADVNCSGGLGGSDIIYLVNYVFKGGAAPCACIVRRI